MEGAWGRVNMRFALVNRTHLRNIVLTPLVPINYSMTVSVKNFVSAFSTTKIDFDPIIINNKEIEVVSQAKLVGLTISNDLKWNSHVKNICKKASTRLYFLRQLKRANVPSKDLLLFNVTCIRPVVEYACEVFHDSLQAYLSDDLERLQKRDCRIILPDHRYNEAMDQLGLVILAARRQIFTGNKLF